MGWFTMDKENVFYSEETLDLAFNFLKEFSEIYQKGLKRKPTVEELENLLKISLSANADDTFLSNFNENKIEDIKFKIAKRKKKLKYEVGNMCTIPLKCGGFAFSRIILLQPPSWYLSEIFAYYSKNKAYNPDIDKSGYLLYPMFITPNNYNEWHSEIIHHIPEYRSPYHDELQYYYGIDGKYQLVKIGENYGKKITEEEAKKFTKQIFYHPDKIVSIIESKLKEKKLIK